MTKKVWFITGASSGFGRQWAEAALQRGDLVAATARNIESLRKLVENYGDAVFPLQLDVTNRNADFDAVKRAADHFGKLDVVINSAGFIHLGMVEELTEDEVRSILETNFLGVLWVTQAALPIMRAQGSGHIIQVTSEGGVTAFSEYGAYHASKWALEGLTQSLAQEVAGFGIHVTMIEPGAYSTNLSSSATHSEENSAYSDFRKAQHRTWEGNIGEPTATRSAILKVVDAANPPLRIFLGKTSLGTLTRDYESRLATWNEWQPVSVEAAGS